MRMTVSVWYFFPRGVLPSTKQYARNSAEEGGAAGVEPAGRRGSARADAMAT